MINKVNVNWLEKDKRKELAVEHAKLMSENYSNEIDTSCTNATIYNTFKVDDTHWSEEYLIDKMVIPIRKEPKTEISVSTNDSVKAIIEHHKYQEITGKKVKCAVLNFASFTNPGGKFLEGSFAQEEALCHNSTLFNVLYRFNDTYYENNRKNKNKGLYRSNVLYTPHVVFTNNKHEMITTCDVITCAAPFTRLIMRYKSAKYKDCLIAMMQIIDHILDAAYKQQVKKLILGAFGCGVFGNNPTDTAAIFMTLLMGKYKGVFSDVEFAIPAGINNDNCIEFDRVMRIFQAYEYDIRNALSKFILVKSVIGEREWLPNN